MNFHDLINELIVDTVGSEEAVGSLTLFRPELVLCVTIIVMLMARVFGARGYTGALLALVGTGYAAWLSFDLALVPVAEGKDVLLSSADGFHHEIFTGLLVFDTFTLYMRLFLLCATILFIIFTLISGIPDQSDGPDFYSLVLGSVVGMCLMVEANHLLIIFLGVEMASVPSYVMVGILKGRRQSSEAALKYAIYGAGAAGIMLYGISLAAGLIGSAHLPTMAAQLAEMNPAELDGGRQMVLVLAGLMIMVGLAFKLSAVPFHFWCPDAFEGAPAEVGGFLSVASKAAALALLVRVALGFGHVPVEKPLIVYQAEAPVEQNDDSQTEPGDDAAMASATTYVAGVSSETPDVAVATSDEQPSRAELNERLAPVRYYMAILVGVLAMITCTFGNLAAYAQTNLKRLLAYSTIAHAGYMMMPVSAVLLMLNQGHSLLAGEALASLVFYATIYLFMNFGAFAIVAFLRNATFSEEIDYYGGLYKTAPGVVVCLALIFFSLIGMPPLAGFSAKFTIFAALVDAGDPFTILMLVVAGINTAISLFYYLRVIKVMAIDPEPEDRPPIALSLFPSIPGTFVLLMTVPVCIFGIWWNPIFELATAATKHLL
ncbi:MAG: NADH-quinone oxidoreductase subunit N [Pirellulales bacterium]|nr:NADH-quinone oxidoreductase subunit N [Pirellulales bacterium]